MPRGADGAIQPRKAVNMEKHDIRTTEWKVYDGGRQRIRASYGLCVIGNQAAYVTVTGEVEERLRGKWRGGNFGMLHQEVAKHFPELAPLIPFHLSSEDGPMHYVANAIYWAEKIAGCSPFKAESYEPVPEDAFRHTVGFGVVEGDTMPILAAPEGEVFGRNHVKDVVTAWCLARLPDWQAARKQALATVMGARHE